MGMDKTCGLNFLDSCVDKFLGKPQLISRRDGIRFILKSVTKGDVNHCHVLAHDPPILLFSLYK
jgi:hypothetical protein